MPMWSSYKPLSDAGQSRYSVSAVTRRYIIPRFCKYSIYNLLILNGSGTGMSATFFEFCDTLTYVAFMVYYEILYFDDDWPCFQ